MLSSGLSQELMAPPPLTVAFKHLTHVKQSTKLSYVRMTVTSSTWMAQARHVTLIFASLTLLLRRN